MMPVKIRPYTSADWTRLCEIHDAARYDELRGSVAPEGFLPLVEVYEDEELFGGQVWVAYDDDADDLVVGFVAATEAELTWIYVDPALYRRGIGRQLLRHALAACDPASPVTLQALAGNTSAIALYEQEGFRIVHTGPSDLNGDGKFPVTGIRMERPAAGAS